MSLARGECEAAQVVLPPDVPGLKVKPLALQGPRRQDAGGLGVARGLPRHADALQLRREARGHGRIRSCRWRRRPTSRASPPSSTWRCARRRNRRRARTRAALSARGGRQAPRARALHRRGAALRHSRHLVAAQQLRHLALQHREAARLEAGVPRGPRAAARLRARRCSPTASARTAWAWTRRPCASRTASAVVDFRAYDAEMGPFLDGTRAALGRPLHHRRRARQQLARTDAEKAAYYRAFAEHFREKGWTRAASSSTPRTSPSPRSSPWCAPSPAGARRRAKDMPVLVTAPLDDALRGSADILAPTLNCFFPRPGPQTCRNVPLLADAARPAATRARRCGGTRAATRTAAPAGPPTDPAHGEGLQRLGLLHGGPPRPAQPRHGPAGLPRRRGRRALFRHRLRLQHEGSVEGRLRVRRQRRRHPLLPGHPREAGAALRRTSPWCPCGSNTSATAWRTTSTCGSWNPSGSGFAREAARRLARSGYEMEMRSAGMGAGAPGDDRAPREALGGVRIREAFRASDSG